MWVRAKAMALGSALGLVLIASSAGAQEYGPPAPGYYGPPEEVIVTPPPYATPRSAIGAPIIDASLSRPVRIDDLDLRTEWGVRELRSRISCTASTLCRQLNVMYPATYDGGSDQWPRNHDCYRDAFDRGMAQAHGAIRAARGEYSGY
jgi:UrcA family protein